MTADERIVANAAAILSTADAIDVRADDLSADESVIMLAMCPALGRRIARQYPTQGACCAALSLFGGQIGTVAAMTRHFFHRWRSAKASAPMSHTK